MIKQKFLLFFFIIIFICMGYFLNANEIKFSTKNYASFNFYSNIIKMNDSNIIYSNIIKYDANQGDETKFKGFRAMGIVGSVIFGLGLPMTIAGIAVTAYGYNTRFRTETVSFSGGGAGYSYSGTTKTTYEDFTTMYIGIGVLVPGIVLTLTGLPLMIVGFSMAKKYRVAMFIDPNLNNVKTGVALNF